MTKLSRFLVLTFLFLLAACGDPPVLTPRDPTPGTFHFTVMSFNVHLEQSGNVSTVEAVGFNQADIVCLQEVTPDWELAIRERYTGVYPYMLFAPKQNPGGLAILSHYPIEDYGVIPVPGDWHPAWHAMVETPFGKIQLMNVHLRSMFNGNSNVVFNYFSKGKDHVYEIELFMKQALPDVPTIVLGDFNENQKCKAVKWLEERGYRNALRLYHPKVPTWRGRSLTASIKMTIDHVMFDDAFEPLNAWTSGRGSSDHHPVVAHSRYRRGAIPTPRL